MSPDRALEFLLKFIADESAPFELREHAIMMLVRIGWGES